MSKKTQNNFVIDFYGPLLCQEYFEKEIVKYSFVSYRGILKPDDTIYQTLSKYDLLLLPTRYKGEGFPGSIIDAYISGIPVICSNWKYLREFVKEGETGYVYELDDEIKMFDKVIQISKSPELLRNLKDGALCESERFSYRYAWGILEKYL